MGKLGVLCVARRNSKESIQDWLNAVPSKAEIYLHRCDLTAEWDVEDKCISAT